MEKGQAYKQLFIGGDLSGIQKFLYNISSRKAAVSLKGRSYYLKRFMENVCETIVVETEKAGAEKTRVIYCSGGKFYLLSDYSAKITQAIDQCARQAKADLWKEHRGQLGISISYVPFNENTDGTIECNGLSRQKPGYLWKQVSAEFNRQKKQKFKDILTDNFSDFFEPIAVGGKPRICAVTGIESPDCVELEPESDEEEKMYVLPSVKEQIEQGKKLNREQHFKGFEAFTGNKYLGVLRMDVDGLGKRFVEGFDSIRQYKEFSDRLVAFFEKRIERLQQEQVFKDDINIIYAGGDDLFIVGQWDKVIDFAELIRQETVRLFAKDNISISGGIAIVKPKFPIAKAAELAGEAEDKAKQFRNGEKNAFHLLGKTVSWDKEFEYVKNYKQQFVGLHKKYDMSKSILHKLMLYSAIADQNVVRRREGKAEDFSYIWHLSYYLTRYIDRYKSPEIRDFCRNLRDKELDYRHGRNLELIALAARWAELSLKDE